MVKTIYGKQCLHKTTRFKTLTQLSSFIFLLKIGEMLLVTENVETLKFERETGPSYDLKFVCLDDPGLSIWNKLEKSHRIG